MTMTEQLAFANEKITHWGVKRERAQAMLTKWQDRLSALQSKGKPQPTAKTLPPVALIAEGSGDKVVPINGKAKPAKAKPPKKH
jgi:ABC-type hemin transport system substrate-binding protein